MSNVKTGKWMFHIGNDETWTGEPCDSKYEAIEEGKGELEDSNRLRMRVEKEIISSFYVGQIAEVLPRGVDVDFILENVAENTAEGMEAGEDYLLNVTPEHSAELEEKLNDVLFAWMKEHEYEPDFFTIENVEEISI